MYDVFINNAFINSATSASPDPHPFYLTLTQNTSPNPFYPIPFFRNFFAHRDQHEKTHRNQLPLQETVLVLKQKIFRTRKELEAEFDLQIQRIEKELRIQNAAQIQANHQVVVFLLTSTSQIV